MKRVASIAGALWMVLAAATPEVSAQARGGAMPDRVAPMRPERAARQQHPLDRWTAMPPKVREAQLAKLPPEKRAQVEQRIANWEQMTPEQKERARHFAALPVAQKQIVRDHADWMKQLAQERRPVVRKEINSLQSLSPEARQAEIESPSFARRFNEDEREHIGKLVPTMPE